MNKKVIFNSLEILIAFLFIISCNSSRHNTTTGLTSFQLVSHLDFYSDDLDKKVTMDDSIIITYKDDYIIISTPNYFENIAANTNNQGEITSEHLYQSGIKYKYFVYKKTDSVGLRYDSLADTNGKRFSVDSLLRKKAFEGAVFIDHNDRLSTIDSGTSIITKKFIPPVVHDNSYSDSTYLFYEHFKEQCPYTLAKDFDNIPGLKLFKLQLIYNEVVNNGNKHPYPRRDWIFEIKDYSYPSIDKVLNLLTEK